jgi:hypothetical protein
MQAHQQGLGGWLLALAVTAALPLGAIASEVAGAGDVEELKRRYLACDREATRRRLSPSEMQTCSLVAEDLLRRGFEGDFERLLSWWRGRKEGK